MLEHDPAGEPGAPQIQPLDPETAAAVLARQLAAERRRMTWRRRRASRSTPWRRAMVRP